MTLQLTVPKLACSACVSTVIEAIQAIDPTATVQADTKTKQVNVRTQAFRFEIVLADSLCVLRDSA